MALASKDVEICGLAKDWDAVPEIRTQLRQGGLLIHPETKKKIVVKTAALNRSVLEPILLKMSRFSAEANDGKCSPLPGVEDIREEVNALMDMNKREVDFETVDREAWTVKRFLAFIKLKIRKREVSQEPCLESIEKLSFILPKTLPLPALCAHPRPIHPRTRISRTWSSSWTHFCKLPACIYDVSSSQTPFRRMCSLSTHIT